MIALLVVAPGLRAQDEVVPLMLRESTMVNDGQAIEREASARRALAMGFASVAAGLLEQLVAETAAGPRLDRLIMDWTMALLEAGRLAEATRALEGLSEASNARAALRRGLVAVAQDDFAGAQEVWRLIDEADLPAAEVAWYHYLGGALADARGEVDQAREAYAAAILTATSGLQRTRFELADLQSSWHEAEPTAAQAGTLRRRMEEYAGERVGFDAAKRYAAVLAALDREPEAVKFLQNLLLTLPPADGEGRDDIRLLLGVIAGATDGLGRNALFRLLDEGRDKDKQRVALRMLVAGSTDAAARATLHRELTRLMTRAEPHPVEQDLLLIRAELATDADEATRDALALLERYPASDLKSAALDILVSAAWEDGRYRSAAGYAAQARRELPGGEDDVRARLGVLQAEAFFRGADYRSAADAYAAALEEPAEGVSPGNLIFQEILARIRDQQLTEAAQRIDVLAGDDRFDAINRWQAEWNLARQLQTADRAPEAYARVNRVMSEAAGPPALPAELTVRMAWLQARLALEAGEPARTLEIAPGLRERLTAVAPVLAAAVDSSLRLIEAEAHFSTNQNAAALAALQELRATYPDSDAAVYSFIEEATAEATAGQLVRAQQLLAELIQSYPDNRYAPYALYQSALLAESRRENVYLEEAVAKIEQLVTDYPDSELVFHARFKQGDLLRKLGLWGPARQVYELIIRNHPQHPDVWAAQMALADCLSAQASGDGSLQDSALAIYERMRDVALAPVELRVEAGYKAGAATARHGLDDRAAELWWQVVDEFLVENQDPANLGTRGRYWLARILAQLGEMKERGGELEEARRAYDLIEQRGLPQADWAVAQLARLGQVPAVEDVDE